MRRISWFIAAALLAAFLLPAAFAQSTGGGGGGGSGTNSFPSLTGGSCTSQTFTVATGCTLTNSGSGTVNATFAPQNTLTGDITTAGGGGTATTLAAIAGSGLTISSPAAGDVICYLTTNTTGNCPLGVVPNAQTGVSYTVLTGDRNKYISFSNAGAIAVTLPQAGSAGFTSNFFFTVCDIGVGTATVTPTTSTISYSDGGSYTSAAANIALSTGKCAWIYSDNSNYFAIVRASGGAALSAITAAAGTNTIANGNNPQIWNFTQATDSQAAFTFGDTAAATLGTVTTSLANQSLLKLSTASASTETPLSIVQGSVTGTTAFPAFQVSSTWNNAGLTAEGVLFSFTKTLATNTSLPFDIQLPPGTSIFKVDAVGNTTVASGGTIAIGNAAMTSTNYRFNIFTQASTFQCGTDTSSTTNQNAGTCTFRGPDVTGASGIQTDSNPVTYRGGDVTSNNSSAASQGVTIRTGRALNGAAAGPNNGPLNIIQTFVKGTTVTANLAACFSADNTVAECGTSATNPVGVAVAVNTNAVDVATNGVVTVNFPSASPSAGWYVCTATLNTGTNNMVVQSTACTAGQQVGYVVKGGTTITSTTAMLRFK